VLAINAIGLAKNAEVLLFLQSFSQKCRALDKNGKLVNKFACQNIKFGIFVQTPLYLSELYIYYETSAN